MKIEIVKLFLVEEPTSGTQLVVVPKVIGKTAEERYKRHVTTGEPLPANQSLVALIRRHLSSSQDIIQVTKAQRRSETISIDLELRIYEGPIAANVETTALVQIELGRLKPGTYAVVVREIALYFQDLQRPDQSTNPTTTTYQIEFHCA